MPVPLLEIPSSPPPPIPERKRWTRAECRVLEASELFHHERVELIEGELIRKMGKKRRHVSTLTLLRAWMAQVFTDEFVDTEAPIDVAAEDNPVNEPEPDLIVLDRPTSTFDQNPAPRNLRLVVEIADSSLAFDLNTKAILYARAAIIEYWVVDVAGRRLIVHRQPQAGRYQSVVAYGDSEIVAPLAASSRQFPIAAIFPA
jgi:Uma2 family endonuclease